MKTPLLNQLFYKDVLQKLNIPYLNNVSDTDINRYMNLFELDYFYNIFNNKASKNFNQLLLDNYDHTIKVFERLIKNSHSLDLFLLLYAYISYHELYINNLLHHSLELEVLLSLGKNYDEELRKYTQADFKINLFELSFLDIIYREVSIIPDVSYIIKKGSKNAYNFYHLYTKKHKNIYFKFINFFTKKDYTIDSSNEDILLNKYAVAINNTVKKITELNKKFA